MMRWVMGLVGVMAMIAAMMLSGCGNAADNDNASSPKQQNHRIRVQQTVPAKPEITDGQAVAERLAELARSVPSVR